MPPHPFPYINSTPNHLTAIAQSRKSTAVTKTDINNEGQKVKLFNKIGKIKNMGKDGSTYQNV